VDFSSSVNVSIGEPIGAADEVMLEMLILMLMLVHGVNEVLVLVLKC